MDDVPEHETLADAVLPAGSALEAFEAEQLSGRETLQAEHARAVARRKNALTWLTVVGVGPAALLAVLLALFFEGSGEVAMGLAGLGAAVLAVRSWRAHQDVREIERELADPMDGS